MTTLREARGRLLLGAVSALLLLYGVVTLQRAADGRSEVRADNERVAGVFALLRERGLAAALDSLGRQSARDSLILRAGHQLAHALGRQAVLAGGDERAIAQCRPDFGSGCYHGAVEAFLSRRKAVDMPLLEAMCAGADSGGQSGSLFECVHGLGHGVLDAVGLEPGRALHFCDELSADPLRESCHEGVFMEVISSALSRLQRPTSHRHGSAEHGDTLMPLSIRPDDPYSPCDGFTGSYGNSCWLFQGFLILRRVGFDAPRALEVCDRAPGGWPERCYASVGHQLTGLFQRDDRWVIDRCRAGRAERAADCAAGAVLALVAQDWSGKRASQFCDRVPTEWQERCRSTYEARMAALKWRTPGAG